MEGAAGTPGGAATRLRYEVDPTKVPFSVDDRRRSIVTLTVTAHNDGGDAVPCSRIAIRIPSDAVPKPTTLTTDPSTVTVSVGDATPWAMATSGDGVCYAVPLPPATGIGAGGTARFVLANILVNTMPNGVDIAIDETVSGATATTTVRVTKDAPVGPGGDPPTIASFTVTPAEAALGERVTVAWQVTGADVCTLHPGPVTLPSPSTGTIQVPVLHTTVFTLEALAVGGRATASTTVTVMPVRIDDFRADPPGPVRRGEAVTLRWATRFAASCAIDQGVGEVERSGERLVTPARTAVYTLAAAGSQPQARSVTVQVAP